MSSHSKSESPRRRRRLLRRPPQGSVPGTIVPDPSARPTVMQLIEFDSTRMREIAEAKLEDAGALRQAGSTLWINIVGLADTDFVRKVCERFQVHNLAQEDVIHTHQIPKVEEYGKPVIHSETPRMMVGHQRPKVEEYGRYLYITFHAPEHSDSEAVVSTEQISLFLLDGIVITFQEGRSDCFNAVRDRIRRSIGCIREAGADYLTYALIDAAIDGFFPITERLGSQVEELEEDQLRTPSVKYSARIYSLRHELMRIRRTVWPMRDLTNSLIRDEHGLFTSETRIHLRDCHDHCVQLMDLVEAHREILAALMEMQLSHASYRMNEVMKVLTIIATLFMPMTFIVGVYGMNFQTDASPANMPELGWKYGYIFALGLCAASTIILLVYFKRKKWI